MRMVLGGVSNWQLLEEHWRVLNEHTKVLNQLQKNVKIIRVSIIWLKNKFKKKTDFEDFIKLEKGIALLEKKLQNEASEKKFKINY